MYKLWEESGMLLSHSSKKFSVCETTESIWNREFPGSACDTPSKQRKTHKSWIDFNRPIPVVSMKTIYSISTHAMLHTDIYKAIV